MWMIFWTFSKKIQKIHTEKIGMWSRPHVTWGQEEYREAIKRRGAEEEEEEELLEIIFSMDPIFGA